MGGRNKQSGENKQYRTKFTECLRNINTFLPALHLLFSPLRALTFLFSIFILLLSIPAHYPNINNAPVKLFPSISFPPTDLNTENLFSFVSNFSHPILFLKNEPSPPPFLYPCSLFALSIIHFRFIFPLYIHTYSLPIFLARPIYYEVICLSHIISMPLSSTYLPPKSKKVYLIFIPSPKFSQTC